MLRWEHRVGHGSKIRVLPLLLLLLHRIQQCLLGASQRPQRSTEARATACCPRSINAGNSGVESCTSRCNRGSSRSSDSALVCSLQGIARTCGVLASCSTDHCCLPSLVGVVRRSCFVIDWQDGRSAGRLGALLLCWVLELRRVNSTACRAVLMLRKRCRESLANDASVGK